MADPDYSDELLAAFPGAINGTMFAANDDGDSDPNIVRTRNSQHLLC